MFGLAINLLGIKNALFGAFGRAWNWITDSSVHLLIVAIAIVGIHDWLGWHEYHKCHRVSESMKQAYFSAQAEARRRQDALDAAHVQTNLAINKESTDAHAQASAGAHDAVIRYASLHPSSCATSGPGAAAVSGDPKLAAGAGSEASMAAITVADLDQLAQGTVRAESCRAWGQSLVDSGLAVVGD